MNDGFDFDSVYRRVSSKTPEAVKPTQASLRQNFGGKHPLDLTVLVNPGKR